MLKRRQIVVAIIRIVFLLLNRFWFFSRLLSCFRIIVRLLTKSSLYHKLLILLQTSLNRRKRIACLILILILFLVFLVCTNILFFTFLCFCLVSRSARQRQKTQSWPFPSRNILYLGTFTDTHNLSLWSILIYLNTSQLLRRTIVLIMQTRQVQLRWCYLQSVIIRTFVVVWTTILCINNLVWLACSRCIVSLGSNIWYLQRHVETSDCSFTHWT